MHGYDGKWQPWFTAYFLHAYYMKLKLVNIIAHFTKKKETLLVSFLNPGVEVTIILLLLFQRMLMSKIFP